MQEKEYKECLDAFNEKSREKTQLVSKLMEVGLRLLVCKTFLYHQNRAKDVQWLLLYLYSFLYYLFGQLVSESEKLRMKKLEELSKSINSLN